MAVWGWILILGGAWCVVSAAVAVIAVAGGGALWGVLGAIIAIPVAVSGLLLVREVFVPRQDAR